MILVGLWSGSKKPFPNLFMNIFLDRFSELYHGVPMHVRDINQEIKLRALVLAGTLNMPAKALF